MQWIKRAFDAVGLTQYPIGRHLAALQSRFGGSVVLCLDVSGSMGAEGTLPQAKEGCLRFVTEALAAGYSVAGVLWDSQVIGHTELDRDRAAADKLFGAAVPGGGTDVVPALRMSERMMAGRSGDRVIAIFGDGDLGNAQLARLEADRLASEGIRVITCGLGDASAKELSAISTEAGQGIRVAQQGDIADAIADMARGLRRR